MADLNVNVIVVTGTGRGLGRAIAERCCPEKTEAVEDANL